MKVAAVQMCSAHVVEENLVTAANFIKEAAAQDAQLVVLPENFAMMGKTETDKLGVAERFGAGRIQSFLSEQAAQNQLWIVGGTIPLIGSDGKRVRAASLVYNDNGECAGRYDKIHLFDVVISDTESYQESATIEPGDTLTWLQTPVGKMGMGICYDVRFPELFRCLFVRGVELLVLPSAFTVKTGEGHWEVLTRSRAIENFSYMIAAAQGGSHTNGRKTYGNSLIIDPWGRILAKKDGVESGVIYADIDLEYLYKIRESIPVGKHLKISYIN